MKRRSRFSDAVRSSKASSIWPSIVFRAPPRRPTSVRGSSFSTRCERSPPAIAAAVVLDPAERPQADTDEPEAEQEHGGEHRRRRRPARRSAAGASVSSASFSGAATRSSWFAFPSGSTWTRKRVSARRRRPTVNGGHRAAAAVARLPVRSGCGNGVSPGRALVGAQLTAPPEAAPDVQPGFAAADRRRRHRAQLCRARPTARSPRRSPEPGGRRGRRGTSAAAGT